MDPSIITGIVGSVGFGAGVLALMRSFRNGNGHRTNGGSPVEPAALRQSVEHQKAQAEAMTNNALRASLQVLTERIGELVERESHPLVIREPQPNPEWVAALETRLAAHTAALVESREAGWTPDATRAIERVVERLEAILQMGPPPLLEATERAELVALIRVVAELPAEIEGGIDQLTEQQKRLAGESERKLLSAVKSSGGSPPPPPRSAPPQPRAIPNPLPPIPHIPPPYIGGTVVVPGGKPENLLLLIQQQLQPNCPGTCVQFRISSEDEIFVGAASFLGGPLSHENYAYKLEPEKPRIYQSAYPGSSTPIGDLQVLGSGEIHVEVQL